MEFRGHPLVSSDAHHEVHATHTRGDVPMPPGAPLHAGMPKNMTPPIKGSRDWVFGCVLLSQRRWLVAVKVLRVLRTGSDFSTQGLSSALGLMVWFRARIRA